MTFLDQDTKLTCTGVSKTFCAAAQEPRVWTEVKLVNLGIEARAFIKKCTHLRKVKIQTESYSRLAYFLSHTYQDTIEDVTVCLYDTDPGSMLLIQILAAFPGVRRLDVELVAECTHCVIIAPDVTLQFFRFWDSSCKVHLEVGKKFSSDAVHIKAGSTTYTGHAECMWLTATTLINADMMFSARYLVVHVDEEGVGLDFPVHAEHVVVHVNGFNIFMDASVITEWKVRELTIESCGDNTMVIFGPISVHDFFDFFMGPRARIDLKMDEDLRLQVWPPL